MLRTAIFAPLLGLVLMACNQQAPTAGAGTDAEQADGFVA